MHIRFSVEIDTLTTEQRRGLSMLLTGIEVPNPYQVGPTPSEPEFEFKTEATIKRSEVELKEGDLVVSALFYRPRRLTVCDGELYPFRIDCLSFTKRGEYVAGHINPDYDITEVNGLKIIEDAP